MAVHTVKVKKSCVSRRRHHHQQLQQEAGIMPLSAEQTMMLAQQLYEGLPIEKKKRWV